MAHSSARVSSEIRMSPFYQKTGEADSLFFPAYASFAPQPIRKEMP